MCPHRDPVGSAKAASWQGTRAWVPGLEPCLRFVKKCLQPYPSEGRSWQSDDISRERQRILSADASGCGTPVAGQANAAGRGGRSGGEPAGVATPPMKCGAMGAAAFRASSTAGRGRSAHAGASSVSTAGIETFVPVSGAIGSVDSASTASTSAERGLALATSNAGSRVQARRSRVRNVPTMRRMPRSARGACRASSRAGETAFVGPWVAKLVTH